MSQFISLDSLRMPLTPYSPFSMTQDTLGSFPTPPVFMSDFQSAYMPSQSQTDYYKMGQEWMANLNANAALTSAAQGLVSLEEELVKSTESEQINEEQKQRLQELLDKIEALKAEVAKASNKSIEEKNDLVNQISQLQEEAANVAKEIAEEIQNSVTEDGGGDAGSAPETETAGAPTTENPENVDAPVTQDIDDNKANEALEICQSIYQGAIGVTGTEYDYIIDGYNGMKGTKAITKDNVTAVLNKWQEQFASGSGDDNVIETLFDEEMFWNPSLSKRDANGKIANPKNNVDIIWNILKCLEERAKELGVYKNVVGLFTAAYNELDDFNIDQSVVENNIMAINQKVIAAENAKKAEENTKKVDADKKNAEATEKAKAEEAERKVETEARTTFLTDMREIWDNDKLEISDKVKYKDGKFVIRIEGNDYYGKDFNELREQIYAAGYDPEKYLSKQPLNTRA